MNNRTKLKDLVCLPGKAGLFECRFVYNLIKILQKYSNFAKLLLDSAKAWWYTILNLIKLDEAFRKLLTEGGGDSGESLK